MLNGAAALGILSGGSPGGGSNLSALNLFRQINKNEAKLRENYFNRKDVQQSIETFKTKISKFEDIDALVKDRKSLQFLLSSFDLDSEINNAGKIKAILKSDINDQNSFANRLNDKRFAELANFVDFKEKGFKNLRTASSQQKLIDKFLQNTFEKDVSGQNPDIAKAFHFLRNINNVSTTSSLLGTLQLREIVTTALRLPQEIARQSIDKQISMVEAKFDVKKAVISDQSSGISNFRQSRFEDDIQAIEIAKSQAISAENALSSLDRRLQNARERLKLLPEISSPDGFNANRIPIHQTAVKQLSEINGVTAAARSAIEELDPILKGLDERAKKILEVETQDDLDNLKAGFAEEAAKISDLIYHTARFRDPDTNTNINLFKPSGGVVDAGSPNSYTAARINYAYQDGNLDNNPITTLSGPLGANPYTVQSGTLGSNPYTVQSATLGSNPYTVQSGTLGSNPFTVESSTLGSNPFTIKGGDLVVNPWRWFANHTPNRDSDNTAILKFRIPDHGLQAGDKITVSGTTNAFGADLNGTYTVHSVRTSDVIYIDVGVDLGSPPATHESAGGNSGTFVTNRVQVNHAGHPFSDGDTATFSGASSVGGQSLNSSFTVQNQSTNAYEFLLGSPGSAAATGGGGSVTVNASNQVTVAHTGHPFDNGDTVTFSGGASVGGVSLNGSYTVANKTDNSYTITAGSQGVAGNGGGSSVTVNASNQVTVAHTGHPFDNGDTVTFSGGASVGGVSLNGSYTVANKTDNSYTITAGSQGVAGNGGGSSVTVNASNKFTVAHTGHPFSNGDTVIFSGGSSVDGVSLNGSFLVTGSTANSYTVEGASQATAGATGGGGSIIVNASNQVTVAQEDHLFSAGDYVTLSNVSSVGGLNLTGTFQIASVSDDTYVITVGSQAIAGQSGGGNAGNYGHTLGPNPFSTNSGSAIVSVADNSHGLAVGDVVQFENSATVGGLDLNVTFRVSGVTDANNYTVTATSNATSSVAAGGGSSVGLTIPELASVFDEKNSSILAQNKDMATFVSKIASAATSVANATLTNAVTDGNAAISNLNDANSELLEAKGVLDANTNAFIRHTNSTTFAATLNTTEITKGRASVLDAIGRLQTIEATLKLIDGYSKETFSSANATKYAADRAAIVSQLDNAGKVTGSTSGVLANNPFQTQSGNAQVTVTHAGHGLTAGDSVTFSGGATVGGLDLNSTFTVASVNDANTYTIAASSNASGNATGGGASVAFAGAPSVTLDNLLSVSGNKTYRIREGVNQFIAANPGLNDVDASGPYAINDSTRLSSLLPSTLTSGNGTSVASGSATFLKNVETVRKQLQRDLPVFDFVANTADPLGVLDSQVKGIKENIDQLFSLGDNRGLNLIDTGAGDLSITLGSIGKKITVGAQNQIKTNLTEAINNYTYSAIQGGESGSLSANPFTVKGGSIAVNPWRWDRTDSITKDESGNAILKFRSVQHGLEAGDSVTISGTATSFGRDLNGTYTVHSVRSTHTIYINVGVDLGDPPVFQINAGGSSGTIATNRVSVAHTAHPFSNGDTATFSGGASVGGASLNDSFTVFNATANSYEILSKTNATAQTNGGGASVEFKTIPTERSKFLFDAYFDVSRALGKMRAERIKLGVEETLLKTEFNKPLEVESQFLKPLQNTDYAKKFIEKYLLIKDLQSTGVSFTPTNNNALAINLIRNINPNRGIGLSVNLLR